MCANFQLIVNRIGNSHFDAFRITGVTTAGNITGRNVGHQVRISFPLLWVDAFAQIAINIDRMFGHHNRLS